MTVSDILEQRGSRYGSFDSNSLTCQLIKRTMRAGQSYEKLSDCQKEALDMVAHKIARIVNGDVLYRDSFRDAMHYFELALNSMEEDGYD